MSTVLEAAPATTSGLPESDQLYEVVDGERVEKVMSSYASWVTLRLASRLTQHVEAMGTGTVASELVFILDEDRNLRRRPDAAYLSPEKWPAGSPPPPTGDWNVVPDLTVEVLSPSNLYEDVLIKLREYFHYGVQESPLVPGWSIAIETLLPHEAAPSVSDE